MARVVSSLAGEGLFAGERKARLRIQPCSVDIDLIIISFMIVEKKRREQAGDRTGLPAHSEDPIDAGGDGGDGGAGC